MPARVPGWVVRREALTARVVLCLGVGQDVVAGEDRVRGWCSLRWHPGREERAFFPPALSP